jgi:predicted ferric reductase
VEVTADTKANGVFVAFAGGTGALVFLDLVSRIILNNLGVTPNEFGKDFIFHFYASFRSEEESYGLELCSKLVELNKKKNLNNFSFNVRLSNSKAKSEHWNQAFIAKELKTKGTIKRVWVCGAPSMN